MTKLHRRLLFIVACIHVISFCQCLSGTGSPSRNLGRRDVLVAAGAATIGGFAPLPAIAAPPMDAAEAIRRSAANIPGYGQTDVFYPSNFAGSWRMIREVEMSGRQPLRLVYPFRFVSSIEDNLVVADRGFNQAELEKAILREVKGDKELASIRSYDWKENNPNDLRLVFSDGYKKKIKTTKRATERTDTTVSSSEFQRLTLDDGRVPSISARRVLTKWQIEGDSISGMEIVYNIPAGDPMAASSNTTPTVISKSRLSLER